MRIANARSGEGFIAVSAQARRKFWLDRARTAAIARHTNAFKINEDVVIPLSRMGEYTDAIERINIEFSLANKLKLVDELGNCSRCRCRLARGEDKDSMGLPTEDIVSERVHRRASAERACRHAGGGCWSIWTARSRQRLNRS